MQYPNPDLFLHFKDAPTKVAYTGTAGTTAELAPGLYYVTTDQDCFFIQGDEGVTADANDIPLWAKERVLVRVTGDGDQYLSAIQSSTGGTLYAIPAKQPPRA